MFFLFIIIIIYIKKATLTLFILCYVVTFVHLLENYDKLLKNDEPNLYKDMNEYVRFFTIHLMELKKMNKGYFSY